MPTPNQYTPDSKIKREAEILLAKIDNRITVGGRGPEQPVIRDILSCYVPCLFKLEYMIVPTVTCCACGNDVDAPIEFRRFGYPVCSAECAKEPERPVKEPT